eukprot:2330087-Prorocentrum_lima.AAC.1
MRLGDGAVDLRVDRATPPHSGQDEGPVDVDAGELKTCQGCAIGPEFGGVISFGAVLEVLCMCIGKPVDLQLFFT